MKIFELKKSLISKARKFARKKHKGQWRKFSDEPYFNHVERVAENIKKYKKSHKSDELIAASYLHDTIENTDTNYSELENKFGKLVSSIVFELSNEKSKIKEKGKEKYLSGKMCDPKKISSWSLCIKLSDRLDNISDLEKTSKNFREKYSKETKYIIQNLEKKRKLTNTQKNLITEIKNRLKKW